ncbi:MAG: aminotransferase class I/II-fold pyridoxal phosphate-dependent enzyme [Gemmatimonadales bacterium]|jgi:8-amino-7-oxononanoate synthase
MNTPVTRERTPAARAAALFDPFEGYFAAGKKSSPAPGSLLDLPERRRWFEVVGWGCDEGLYTYQQPLEGCTGRRVRVQGRSMLMLSAYDYLGLVGHPKIERAAVDSVRRYGTSTGGVRMLTGTTELHLELERELADFKGVEAAITFGSGYMANLAAVSALVGPDDQVILDERSHRSLSDACLLARVPTCTFRHNDPASLDDRLRGSAKAGRTLIAVDGLYSMDGDVCPLPELVELKRRYGAFLLVDEAHSLGALGPTGRGVDEHFGLAPDAVDIWTGALSKAIPSNGGFLAGSRELIIYLQHAAAPFWFSAALCPPAVAAASAALRVVRREPQRLTQLAQNAARLGAGLRDLGYETGAGASAIIPVIVGEAEATWRLARGLFDRGVIASAVVHPAVPRDGARLRICATAAYTEDDLDEALDAFDQVRRLHQ